MKRFKDILCVIDPARPADSVFERAVSLARNNQANLTLVSVAVPIVTDPSVPNARLTSTDLQRAVIADLQRHLEGLGGQCDSDVGIQTKVLVGTPFLEIIREVLRHRRDLVMLAPEDPNWIDRLFGSDDMHLLRKCPCPVWFIKPSPHKTFRQILAAVDIDTDQPPDELPVRHALNVQILELAISLALSEFAELHVAHAWQAIGESAMRGAFLSRPEDEVTAFVEQVRQQHEQGLDNLLRDVIQLEGDDAVGYLNPNRHLLKGQPRREIPALAKRLDVDLVVMGTVARTGVPGFFIGNTAETILDQIGCSVLAVKPRDFKTPVSL